MKVLHEIPPIFYILKDTFDIEWGEVIIAYSPNIYCGQDITEQKLVHEKIHLVRQRQVGVDNWWEMYINNDAFRLEEEVLACKAEVKWVKENIPTRYERRTILDQIYKVLSSYMYRNLVTYDEAKKLLT